MYLNLKYRYNKLNLLHLHLVDFQSFPFASAAAPALVQGAYSQEETYTPDQLRKLVSFAKVRTTVRPSVYMSPQAIAPISTQALASISSYVYKPLRPYVHTFISPCALTPVSFAHIRLFVRFVRLYLETTAVGSFSNLKRPLSNYLSCSLPMSRSL